MIQSFWQAIKEFENAYSVCRKAVMNCYELSAIEVDVLLFLANNKQFDTASDISTIRKIPKSHVSLAVNCLFKKGYLKKNPDVLNKKKIHLTITNRSAEIVHYGIEQQKEFTDVLLNGFSVDELNTLKTYFNRMEKNICKYERIKMDQKKGE